MLNEFLLSYSWMGERRRRFCFLNNWRAMNATCPSFNQESPQWGSGTPSSAGVSQTWKPERQRRLACWLRQSPSWGRVGFCHTQSVPKKKFCHSYNTSAMTVSRGGSGLAICPCFGWSCEMLKCEKSNQDCAFFPSSLPWRKWCWVQHCLLALQLFSFVFPF